MNIIGLPSNSPPERFYRGGRRVAAFRGEPDVGDRVPEDWIASTTTLAGESSVGLTVLPDGRPLVAAIEDDPVGWLGQAHVDRFGADTKLLVKLLDAGQRLPVHAHPDARFARRHLGRAHGKAEAWFMLRGGRVHLGTARHVGRDELRELVLDQDVDGLLRLLNEVVVRPGDVVYVPPGVLHSIDEGCFVVELQEPEDLSILLEWRDFDLDGTQDGHLGLGFDLALEAVERGPFGPHDLETLVRPAGYGPSVLPEPADPYFRLERTVVDGHGTIAPGFAVIVVIDGTVRGGDPAIDLPRGTTAVVPHAVGALTLTGRGDVLVCRPPAPLVDR